MFVEMKKYKVSPNTGGFGYKVQVLTMDDCSTLFTKLYRYIYVDLSEEHMYEIYEHREEAELECEFRNCMEDY